MNEWNTWIAGLPEEGFGRYNKQGWIDWLERMVNTHGGLAPGESTARGSGDAAGGGGGDGGGGEGG